MTSLAYVVFVAVLLLYSSTIPQDDHRPFSKLKLGVVCVFAVFDTTFFQFLGHDSNLRDTVDSLRLMHGFLMCVPFLVLQSISTTSFTPITTLVAGCFNLCLSGLLFHHEFARWIVLFSIWETEPVHSAALNSPDYSLAG